jgi:hypothetical protein
VFAQYYKDIKGLVEEMGEMKIELILGEKLIKKRPYKLAHKYNPIVHQRNVICKHHIYNQQIRMGKSYGGSTKETRP